MIEKIQGEIVKEGDFEGVQLSVVESKLNELIDVVNEQDEIIETLSNMVNVYFETFDAITTNNKERDKKIDFIMENSFTEEIKEQTQGTTTFKNLKELYENNCNCACHNPKDGLNPVCKCNCWDNKD